MEAHPRRLKSVFSQDQQLAVPLFQRPYVWQAAAQWEPLWEDVLATFERLRHGDESAHFLGAVVLQQKRNPTGSVELREVIDGQQRLTTMQLLAVAVWHALESRSIDSSPARQLHRMLFNDVDSDGDGVDRYKLWPTNRDRVEYRNVMDGRYLGAVVAKGSGQIVGGYMWFRDQITAWLPDDASEAEEALVDLAKVLRELMEVVVIDLGEGDDSQVIFETLNARGTPLRAADLVKNLLFRILEASGRPIEKLYATYWHDLDDPYWETEVRIGRLLRQRLDVFMGYFLVVLLNKEVPSHSLFDETRRHVGGDPDRAEALLEELARYAAVYRQLDEGRVEDDAERARLARLTGIVDTQTVYPVLLWLFANVSREDRGQAVAAIESYVVRRALCRMTQKNLNRAFLDLLRRLGQGETPVGDIVETYLAGLAGDSGVWPTDSDLERAFTTFALYRMMRREPLTRVLAALNEQAGTSKTEQVVHPRGLTVEHLLPQAWREHWPLPDEAGAVVAEREAAVRDELLHTIGNLTLVTGSLNSALSNGPWPAKRQEILRLSALNLNRLLPGDWGTARIDDRSRWLAGLATEVWYRPPAADAATVWEPEGGIPEPSPTPASRDGRGERTWGDIARHISAAFTGLPSGTFLTINEIQHASSDEYPDKLPSAGAISARLFPGNREVTVTDVAPEIRNGVRGARKL